MTRAITAIFVLALVAAPIATTPAAQAQADGPFLDAGGGPCRSDGARLGGSGICYDSAANYLHLPPADQRPALPDGCNWAVNETALPDGWLLYFAAQCGSTISHLDFAGGARTASLSVDYSALGGSTGPQLATVVSAEGDPFAGILALVREDIGAARALGCAVHPPTEPGAPRNLYTVADLAELQQQGNDGPRASCGRFGFNEDSFSFWAIADGFAWHFDFGQDAYQDIVPESLTILREDGRGGFAAIPIIEAN